jgi:hypothetical protein
MRKKNEHLISADLWTVLGYLVEEAGAAHPPFYFLYRKSRIRTFQIIYPACHFPSGESTSLSSLYVDALLIMSRYLVLVEVAFRPLVRSSSRMWYPFDKEENTKVFSCVMLVPWYVSILSQDRESLWQSEMVSGL